MPANSKLDHAGNAAMPDGIQTRRGLSNSHAVFSAGGKARVAFLGGSITEMHGWRNHVADSLQARYPRTQFDFVFGGIGSTDSTMGAFRLEKDILSNGKVDLLFVESAVNELHNQRTRDEIQCAVEGIIRHTHAHNPDIDIIAQYFYDPAYLEAVRTGQTPWQIKALDALSDYYQIPSIDQVICLDEALKAGAITQEEFGDCHPNPKGHLLYAESICKLFDQALRGDVNRTSCEFPAPLRGDNFENGCYLDIQNAKLGEGWRYVEKWAPLKGNTRAQFVNLPVLETTSPGSELTLAFYGTAIGLTLPVGYDAGILEYKIDNGPAKAQDLFTKWSRGLHIPWIYMLATGLAPGPHHLTLRMTDKKNEQSEGHACRICWFAVNSNSGFRGRVSVCN